MPAVVLALGIACSELHGATIEQLTRRPDVEEIKISPDGRYLAVLSVRDEKRILVFFEREGLKVLSGFKMPGRMHVGNYYWVSEKRVVGEVLEVPDNEEAPGYYGELFATNVDGTQAEMLFGFRSAEQQTGTLVRKKDSDRAWAQIIDVLPEDPRHILISTTPWTESRGSPPRVVRLDVNRGLERKIAVPADRSGSTFYTDRTGEVRVITNRDAGNTLHVRALPPGGEWLDLASHGRVFEVLAITDDGTGVYALDDPDDDRAGLYRLALDGSGYELVYGHKRMDITSAVLSTDERSVYALRVDDGYPSYLIFSGAHEEAKVFRDLLTTFAGKLVSIRSRTRDGRYWIVRLATDTDPGTFYLFDRHRNEVAQLYRERQDVNPAELSPTRPVEFESFDGERVQGYFTPAVSDSQTVAPLVVLVHGGPLARDYWGYDPEVQVLATRGFSVLQINYRGSTGYGRRFEKLGRRHWGDHVQRDILAGTRWAISQQLAPKGKVCIMGASFGAYSAVQSAILAPDLYACVIANAGIYDLPLLYRRGDIKDLYFGEAYLQEQIGQDEEELRSFSPVYHVEKLQAPVFLAHGRRDGRAPMAHARRLKQALEEHDVPHVWFLEDREAHGFYRNENQVKYLKAVTDFLHKHLM
jgi:dipeptidyl aminopeptidase/acylaminoacyl peptidase